MLFQIRYVCKNPPGGRNPYQLIDYSVLWQKPLHRQKIQRAPWQQKNAAKTSIADRLSLRTVSLGNDSHPIGVVKPVNGIQTSHLPQQLCNREYEHTGIILQLVEISICAVSKENNIKKIF